MRGAALRQDEYVDIARLFQFARDSVEGLARDIGGVQQPVLAAPKAASFDVGRLTSEDKRKIPLRIVRPLFLRSNFQADEEFEDVLAVARRIDAALADAAGLAFVDTREFPGAFRLVGRYGVADRRITVRVRLWKGKEEFGRFSVTGPVTDLATLSGRIVEKAAELVR